MPTKTQNSFQQFVSGLFGNISGTPAAKTPTASYQGPYAPGYGLSTAPKPAASAAPAGRNPHFGANASYFNPADATASMGTVPFIPSGMTGGGMSIMPNSTSAKTGLPANSAYPQAQTPSRAAEYPDYIRSITQAPVKASSAAPQAPAAPLPPSTTTSTAPTSASAPAPATSTGPAAAAGSYSAPSGYTSGSSGGTTDYRKAYTDMLSSLYNPGELKSSRESLDRLRRQGADSLLRQRGEDDRIRGNETGQGLKSYNGQLAENSRLGAKEQADLAIASSPYEAYIKSAVDSAKDIYGVGRDQATDERQAAQDAASAASKGVDQRLAQDKFNEDVRQYGLDYALKQRTEPRLGTEAAKVDKKDYVAQYASAFQPGNVMADGTPTIDPNGFITPKAFKEAAAEAVQYGITRKEFIDLFGSMLYSDKDGMPDNSYGLTPVEKKLVSGALS